MKIIQRAKQVLLEPHLAWPEIEAEPADVASLFRNYACILALIPAVAGFIGVSLVGVSAFGVNFRLSIFAGLGQMITSYVMSLVMVYLLALLIDALANTFGGTKNPINALKLSAYASTAALLGGIFSIVPLLALLGIVPALYSVYLIYTGLPVLMKVSREKSIIYTAVVSVGGLLGIFIISLMISVFTGR
ncbi:Yip1 family protein [Variovorax paradoxus]|uniref:Yip1 family protein n=1 Tax=Variovorax paradoxus TaxID=34073 RepID=UPI003D657297